MLVDAEVIEDSDLVSALNGMGLDCDHCRRDEPLVAVVRFEDDDLPHEFVVCGDCYRQMKGMALGEVA